MIEPITYWAGLIGGLITITTALNQLFKAIDDLAEQVDKMKQLPKLLKLLIKFLTYSLTLLIPNVGIIWLFFYLAGLHPEMISEARFFLAIVTEPTIGVSIYAYIWGSWIYPKLQRVFNNEKHEKHVEKKSKDTEPRNRKREKANR